MTKPLKTDTLRRLEKAAMDWHEFCVSVGATKASFGPQARSLFLAIAAHAKAKAGRGEEVSRSGYSEDCDGAELNLWRGAVERAIKGKRGQAFLKEMLAAMDAMPVKRLIDHDLVRSNGEVCAIGSVAVARGTDLSGVEPECDDSQELAKRMGIARAMVKEIEFINDDDFCYENASETPEQRFARVYDWVKEQLKARPDGR